jgi:hypothetical protein
MDGQNNNRDSPVGHSDLAPDKAISLRSPSVPVGLPAADADKLATSPSQAPATAPAEPTTAPPQPQSWQAAATGQTSGLSQSEQPAHAASPAPADISWTASEFVAHPKTIMWYLALAGVTLVVLVLAWFIGSHDIVTEIVVIICAGLFGYMAGRQPRQMQYGLSSNGVQIGIKTYPYQDFRSFAIVDEGAFSSIDFMPLKRFSPMMSIYYHPEQETDIMERLTLHLPFAAHHRTAIDGLMQRIRF